MIWIFPLRLKESEIIQKPFCVFEDDKVKIEFTEFTPEERESHFLVKNVKDEDNGFASFSLQSEGSFNSHFDRKLHDQISCRYAYKVHYEPPPKHFNDLFILELFKSLEYATLIILNRGFNYYFSLSGSVSMPITGYPEYPIKDIDNDSLLRIKELFKVIHSNQFPDKKKLELLLTIIKTMNLEGIPPPLHCSLSVTILESLFSNKDEKSEIRYRFPLRMTKYLGGSYDKTFKSIRVLYDNRSAYYHTGANSFNNEDNESLREYIKEILSDYILNPDKFQGKEMDKNLLK